MPSVPARPRDGIGPRSALGLGAIALATFLAATTEVVPVGLLPQLVRDYGVPTSVAGLLVTVFAVFVAVLAVPLTLVTARLPRRPLLLSTLLLYSVANAVIAVAPSFAVVCAGRALGGVAHALFFSVSTAYAAALVPARLQGRAITVALAGGSLGFVLGVPLLTAVGAEQGQRAAFAGLAATGVLVAAATAVLLPPVPVAPVRVAREAAGPRRGLVLVAAVNAVAFLAHFSLYTYVSTVLLAAGLSERALSGALLLIGAAGVAGLWFTGAVIDRFPRAGMLAALGGATLCVAVLLAVRGETVPAVVATVGWIVCWGALPGLFAAANLRTRVLSPDLSAAVNNAASNVGIGGGAAIGGLALALGGDGGPIVTAVVLFAAAVLAVAGLRVAFPSRPPG